MAYLSTHTGATIDAAVTANVNATENATANTVAKRDANGRLKVVAPAASTDAANKAYADRYLPLTGSGNPNDPVTGKDGQFTGQKYYDLDQNSPTFNTEFTFLGTAGERTGWV